MTREAARGRARARAREAASRRARSAPKPFRDEKILASWNGLMAGALADAGRGARRSGARCRRAARALGVRRAGRSSSAEGDGRARVLRHVEGRRREGPRLPRRPRVRRRRGARSLRGHRRSRAGSTLARIAGRRDPRALPRRGEDDSFYFTPDDGEAILIRPKDPFDHAVPGGASIACKVLLRLGALVDAKYAEPATRAVESARAGRARQPLRDERHRRLGRPARARLGRRRPRRAARPARRARGPRARSAPRVSARSRPRVARSRPIPRSLEAARALAEGKAAQGEPVAYVCRGRTCSLPIRDPGDLARALRPICEPAQRRTGAKLGPEASDARSGAAALAGSADVAARAAGRVRGGPAGDDDVAGAHLLDGVGRSARRRAAPPRGRRAPGR